MKRLLAAGLLIGCLAAAGCGKPSTACAGTEGTVTVCVDGRPLEFPAQAQPHWHDARLYAPVEPLAHRLGLDVRIRLDADGQSALLSIDRMAFAPAMAHGALGVHVHEGVVFVPLRELALATGLPLEIDPRADTAGFSTQKGRTP